MTPALRRLVGAFLTCAVAGALTAFPAEGQTASSAPLAGLRTCLESQEALSVLMLFDESGSLDSTDPRGQRVVAAIALLRALDRLAQGSSDVAGRSVDVALAGFSEGFLMRRTWTPLDDSSVESLAASIEAFANLDEGLDTDFYLALKGAQREMAQHALASETSRCQAVVLFTDGAYSFDLRDERKPYGPDIPITTQDAALKVIGAGRRLLCDAKSPVADQIRNDGVTLITVALARDIADADRGFIESLSMRTGAGGAVCGLSEPNGAYLAVEQNDELIRAFDDIGNLIDGGTELPTGALTPTPCDADGPPCVRAELPFTIDRALLRVHVLAETTATGIGVDLARPLAGDAVSTPITYEQEGTVEISGVRVAYEWLSESALDLDLELPPELVEAWEGDWMVRFWDLDGQNPEIAASAQIYIYEGLKPSLVNADAFRLRRGLESEIVVEVVNEAGDAAGPADSVTRTLSGSIGGVSLIFTPFGVDRYRASYTPPLDLTASQLELVLSLGLELSTDSFGTLQLTDVPASYSVPLDLPVGYPTVTPAAIDFGKYVSSDGAAPSVSRVLSIEGGSDPSCVWFTLGDFPQRPEGVGIPAITFHVRSEDGGWDESPSAGERGSCVEVAAGATLEVRVELAPSGEGFGLLEGTVVAHLLTDVAPEDEAIKEIPASLRLAVAPNTSILVGTFVLLFVFGLGIPLGIQYALNKSAARFEPTDGLRVAVVRLAVGDVVTRPGDGGPLLAPEDFTNLRSGTTARLSQVAIDAPGARPLTLMARISRIPVLPPFGRVRSDGSQVITVDESEFVEEASVPLSLNGAWVFVGEGMERSEQIEEFSTDGGKPVVVGTLYCLAERPAHQIDALVSAITRLLPAARSSYKGSLPSDEGPSGSMRDPDSERLPSDPLEESLDIWQEPYSDEP